MEQVPALASAAPGIIYLAIIVLCVLDKIKIAASLGIITLSISPFTVALIYKYAFPVSEVHGAVVPAIPFAISGILFVTALILLTPVISSHLSSRNTEPKISRWLFLLTGLVFHFIGIGAAFMFWYSPQIFGSQEPSVLNGVIAYNIFVLMGTMLLYTASRQNSNNRPNLMRKIVLLLVVFWIGQTTLVLSFILIYSPPSTQITSFPNEASYNFLASIILAALLVQISREVKNKELLSK